jgi:hypothetical protein
LTILAFLAAIVGQRVVRKLIDLLGRASIIVFILSFMIFISALSLGTRFPSPHSQCKCATITWFQTGHQALKFCAGGVGISNTIHKIARHEYMGFENICKYEA